MVDRLPELVGLPAAEVAARFGPPSWEQRFTMAACDSRLQTVLHRTYPRGSPGLADVSIWEQNYDFDGYGLTIWLHAPEGDWVVVETIRYTDDVEF